jgi:hypothetical protein
MTADKPYLYLSPNDNYKWWRITEIIDETYVQINTDIECYFIIQDANMCGNFWYISTWYFNCPNRYSKTVYNSCWPFDKQFSDILEGDVISLLDSPDIKFKVHNCKNVFEEQTNFCKILERII